MATSSKSKGKTKTKKVRPPSKKGMTVKTSKGLNKKNMDKRSGAAGLRFPLKKGVTIPCMVIDDPTECEEFEMHIWEDGDGWHFVPCLGDACPLCGSDSEKVRGTSYRFAANVYNLEEKRVQVLVGPQTLAKKVYAKWEKKPNLFKKRAWEVTMYDGTPVEYGFDRADEDPLSEKALKKVKPVNLMDFIKSEAVRYYGDDVPDVSSLDADDDDDYDDDDEDDDEDDAYTKEDLRAMKEDALRKIAKRLGVKKTKGVEKKILIKNILRAQ